MIWPSGLGYSLENRALVSRQFPDAFAVMGVQQVAKAYQSLLRGIRERAPGGSDAPIALLTPGLYNETYFEHAYLARYLGLSLVQGSDLLVRDEKLYLKTLQGLQRVHTLLKRVDDDWPDPLELRADSTLGVPGLLQAVLRGNVLLAAAAIDPMQGMHRDFADVSPLRGILQGGQAHSLQVQVTVEPVDPS